MEVLGDTATDDRDERSEPECLGALYTVRQVALLLNVGRSTVWRLMEARELDYVRIGRNRRIESGALRNFIAEHRAAERVPASHRRGALPIRGA